MTVYIFYIREIGFEIVHTCTVFDNLFIIFYEYLMWNRIMNSTSKPWNIYFCVKWSD